jgi:Lsr2
MAQRTEIILTDDLDGSPADETVRFGVDGTQYEIDLSKGHAGELRAALAPFVQAARRVAAPRRPARAPARKAGPSPADVRAWAKTEGIEVKEKGRVPAELMVRFQEANIG